MKKLALLFVCFVCVFDAFSQEMARLLFGDEKPKTTYLGQMADNGKDKTGTGMQLLSKGNIYIGDFLHSKFNGLGMMLISENGEVKNCPGTMAFVGKWVNGKKEGKGVCYAGNGDILYEGMFSNDKPMDQYPSPTNDISRWFSTLDMSNGEFYLGEVRNGNPDGFGLFILNDGQYSISRVKNNERTGSGVILSGDDSWQLVKWNNSKSFVPITSSRDYAERKAVYNEAKARINAKLRSELSEVVSGLMGVASDFQNMRSGGNSTVSTGAAADDSGSSSAGSKTRGNSSKSKSSKSDCGSAWMSDSKVYSDYESQIIRNGSRSSSLGDIPGIQAKMRAIRLKWEARGCKITKSPYED